MKGLRWLFRCELCCCGLSLAGTGWRIVENYRGLSFGGFMALFLLVLLVPSALMLAGGLALHRRSIKTGQLGCSAVASALQLLAPLCWLGLHALFGYRVLTPEPALYWCEWGMLAGMAAGALGLVLLLPCMIAARLRKAPPPEEPVNQWRER